MSNTGTGMAVPTPGAEDDEEPRDDISKGEPDKDIRVSWIDEYGYLNMDDDWGEAFSNLRFQSPYSRRLKSQQRIRFAVLRWFWKNDTAAADTKHSEDDLFREDAEGSTFPPFSYYYPAEEGENEVEKFLYQVPSYIRRETVGPEVPFQPYEDTRRRSLFVHSSPTHFPDVNFARKSVFGSIFLRTTGHLMEDAALLRSVADSSYSMLHSLLNSYEKIISTTSSESDRRNMALAYKQSLLKTLETHGISRTCSDGSVHWNIYPIAHDYLFSVQVGDHVHQTRLLSRIEERFMMGSLQKPRVPYAWPTDSVWTGHWDTLGMAGAGTYAMPHGVSYNGKLQNGMFHDDNATLTYPNKFKALHCVFVKGKLQSCQFQFPDMLMHEKENWGYCKSPDRRFWSEVRNGLKPAKIAQKTEIDPPRKIPLGWYDTNDGFYDPKSLMLVSPLGELLRVPVCEEDIWIKKYCRKGFLQPADFRPDLFENWFNYDQKLIQEILDAQASYRVGKMTYDELQQFYADLDLLPSSSPYKRRKSPSEIAKEEYMNSIPEPVPLKLPRVVKKYQGHAISVANSSVEEPSKDKLCLHQSSKGTIMKSSKSFLKYNTDSKQKLTSVHGLVNTKVSKISFRLGDSQFGSSSERSLDRECTGSERKIPEKYLKYQPILKPPFASRAKMPSCTSSRSETTKKNEKKWTASPRSPEYMEGEDFGEAYEMLRKKELKNFMKSIIMDSVSDILKQERERHKKRLHWARKFPQEHKTRTSHIENCLHVLGELFESIPDKEEFCDSDPLKTCDLRKLAEDKYQMLHYWGKRMYLLDFKEQVP